MIKNQGGVFGRNPTFNDVTVEGDTTIDGDVLFEKGNSGITGVVGFEDDSNRFVLLSESDEDVVIGTNGVEAIRVNKSGSVTVGDVNNPNASLHIKSYSPVPDKGDIAVVAQFEGAAGDSLAVGLDHKNSPAISALSKFNVTKEMSLVAYSTTFICNKETNSLFRHDYTQFFVPIVLERRDTPPVSASGAMYFNNNSNKLSYYNGSNWVDVGGTTQTVKDLMSVEPSDEPQNASAGDIYFDKSTKRLRCFNGDQWKDLHE